jgi:L-ribulose-5-phosphate 4-epimerase
MKYEQLCGKVAEANRTLGKSGLVLLTWGNVSAADHQEGVMAIKPSGVPYENLTPADMVVMDIKTGAVREGRLKPSSDAPTHLELYRAFPVIGGLVHTHSHFATLMAQLGKPIKCRGTTHADYFYGEIPVTGSLEKEAVAEGYEKNTGLLIADCFRSLRIDPMTMEAVLVRGHGPFVWGISPDKAIENSLVLEEIAAMEVQTLTIDPDADTLDVSLLDKHYFRKHGRNAYYGQ